MDIIKISINQTRRNFSLKNGIINGESNYSWFNNSTKWKVFYVCAFESAAQNCNPQVLLVYICMTLLRFIYFITNCSFVCLFTFLVQTYSVYKKFSFSFFLNRLSSKLATDIFIYVLKTNKPI